MSGHAACLSIPPATVKGYVPKGSYTEIAGMKTYITGPADAKKAILQVFDIFGFYEQTIQGADILAYGDKENPYRVLIPDFFDGAPAAADWYPPGTEEKKKLLSNFFATKAAPPSTIERIPKVIKEIEAKEGPKSWGAVGMCWGGKIVALTSGSGTPYKAAAMVHPGMVDAKDAAQIKIPFAVLASMDEPVDEIKKFESSLTGPKHVETFGDQIHGWMGARGDLSVPRNKAEYERGYKTVLEFFHSHI